MDRGQITLLGMIDLSATFDTVDHAIRDRAELRDLEDESSSGI